MNQPRQWRKLERHPLSNEYADISGDDRERAAQRVREFGVVGGRKIMLHEGKIIDGWQLQLLCIDAGVKPTYGELKLPNGMDLDTYVEIVNDNRRHETREIMLGRAAKRRERVAKARAEGQSIRAIADKEEVSKAAIQNDLKEIAKDSGVHDVQLPEKVTGIDGKKYAADMPKRDLPPRLRNRSAAQQPLPPKKPAPTILSPAPPFRAKADAICAHVLAACETLRGECEGSDSVLRKGLERFSKVLQAADADVDALLNPSSNGKPTKEERNGLFDAIADVTGMDKKSSGSWISKVVKSFLKAEPPYTAADVRELPNVLKREFPWMKGRLHIVTLEKCIGVLRATKAESPGLFASLKRFVERGEK